MPRPLILLVFLLAVTAAHAAGAGNWPRWRGPGGNAVADGAQIPTTWTTSRHVAWKIPLEGEGASSPIVWEDRIYLASAREGGTQRVLQCFTLKTGRALWTRAIEDDDPEITSALTGHAAATPVTDGQHVVAFFGNAGAVCYDVDGRLLWQKTFGTFESELGLASSPIIDGERVILICDHDGTRFKTFDSFLTALDVETGRTLWKTGRPGLFRSWSTPILVPANDKRRELIVNGQDELRGYDPETGRLLWSVPGMTRWVTPSPVFAGGLIFATSGKDGPTVAVRPGGRGNVTDANLVWKQRRGAPYVCSPLWYDGLLYVHNESGILTCFDASNGKVCYQHRLDGKFTASGVASDGRIYLTNDEGVTFVVAAGKELRLLAKNRLEEEILASPAIAAGCLLLRTAHHLYCVGKPSQPGSRIDPIPE